MKWVKSEKSWRVPVKSWCEVVDGKAMEQVRNLANHPVVFKHVALMPDAHAGYGMPIGGVIACENAVIPNAVGVDIGCGMGAVETDYPVNEVEKSGVIRTILEEIKKKVPMGEGNAYRERQEWEGINTFLGEIEGEPGWKDEHGWELAYRNLGTLGGGNHFIELQASEEGKLWLMLHSGSRNLGHRIASWYHQRAMEQNALWHSAIPATDLAFLPVHHPEGQAYIRDMNFALKYAEENRRRMMMVFKEAVTLHIPGIRFLREINIHHNYANIENHFGKNVWVHRKGATSAQKDQMGIIPGSMGTSSYIVKGLGNPESFASCSHGAGRKMGRLEASRNLTVEECDKAMEGIVFDPWKKMRQRGKKKKEELMDLGESPLAYKDIDEVIQAEVDLIQPLVKLRPLGVLKG